MIKELFEKTMEFEHKKDLPEHSLTQSLSLSADFVRKRTESNSRKRKQSYVELQVNDPLPSEWERCLDLQSGSMYYLNRRTLTKMWSRPYKEQKLDLELSIMPAMSDKVVEKVVEKQEDSDDGGMVAVVCINCHLLVMLSRASPFCPNCRHMHSVFMKEQQKVIKTLNLLN